MAQTSSYDLPSERLLAFAPALYVVGLLLLLVPVVEFMIGLPAVRFTDFQWRFGAVGLLTNSLGSMPVGLVLLAIAPVLQEKRLVLRTIAVVSLIIAVLLVTITPLFVLDSLQLKGRVPPANQTKYLVTWLWAIAKLLGLALAALIIGVQGLRASKRPRSAARRERTTPPGLVAPIGMPRVERPATNPAPGSGRATGIARPSGEPSASPR